MPNVDQSFSTASTVLSTMDRGKTWSASPIAVDDEFLLQGYANTAFLDFVDVERGWMLLRQISGAAYSRGDLFSTKDGGKTWSKLPIPPIAGPIDFLSPLTGWLVGGVRDNELYRTQDGGFIWERKQVVRPGSAPQAVETIFGKPVFEGLLIGQLSVTFAGEHGAATVALYWTHDGGNSWNMQSKRTSGWETVSIVDSTAVGVMRLDNSIVFRSGSAQMFARLPPGVPKNIWVHDARFINPVDAWVLMYGAPCTDQGCRRGTALLGTNDGGDTVRVLLVSQGSPGNGRATDRK